MACHHQGLQELVLGAGAELESAGEIQRGLRELRLAQLLFGVLKAEPVDPVAKEIRGFLHLVWITVEPHRSHWCHLSALAGKYVGYVLPLCSARFHKHGLNSRTVFRCARAPPAA